MMVTMVGDRGAALRRLLDRLLGPSPRIVGDDARAGARLMAALTLAHLLASVLIVLLPLAVGGSALGQAASRLRELIFSLGSVLVLASYVLVRAGKYRHGLITYLITTGTFPLLAPFLNGSMAEVGLLGTALVPMVVAATLLSRGWLFVIAAGIVVGATVELSLAAWPPDQIVLGFTNLLIVLASSVMMALVMRHHGALDAERVEQLRRSEAALVASQRRVTALMSASRDLVVVLNADLTRGSTFGDVEGVTGHSPDQPGQPLAHLEALHPEDRARVEGELAELARQPGRSLRSEWRYRHRDGSYRWHEALITNRLHEEGIEGLVLNIRDITDRRRAEEAVMRSERRYRTLFSTVTDGVFLLARDGRIIEANDAACRMLGYSRDELLTKRLEDIAPADRREHTAEINELVAQKGRLVFSAMHRRKDGSVYPVEVAASLVELDGVPTFMGVSRDITERVRAEAEKQRLQDQLNHAIKMESVGRLAGGVAHDFNNLLTAMLGNAELARSQVDADGPVAEALDQIRSAALSAATVTRQLLTFSRKQVLEASWVDLNQLIEQTRKMLARLIGEDVRLRTMPGRDVGAVRVDPGLIEQALVNLVVNARDAMPRGGELVIRTEPVDLDAADAGRLGLRAPGRHVLLSVRDTGTGMSDEVKRHLFEPFFTTKPRGMGTGLGLAMTYAVVEQSGGAIDVQSELGQGTTFRLYLPMSDGPATPQARPWPGQGQLGGNEVIMVVEDEPAVREVAVQVLRSHGYHVLVATGGEEAVAMAASRPEPIQLLLTDIVMPGMNGRELAMLFTKVHPETRTLYTSGYSEDIIARGGALETGIEFLAKPYTPDELTRRVREILDRPLVC